MRTESRTRPRRPVASLVGAVALAVVTMAFLASHAMAQSGASSEATFVFATREEPASIDPHSQTNNPPKKIFEAVYEALLDYDPETLEIVPTLAESWEIAPDGLSVTFRLRSDVVFHDGTMMDAEAVKYSFDRFLGMGLGFASLLGSVNAVEVVDASTVMLDLSFIDPGLMEAIPLVYIVSPTAFLAATTGDDWGTAWAAGNAVGTGPYKLDEWLRNQQFNLSKHEPYWRGWDKPHISRYVFRLVAESATQRQLVERGTAHMADLVEYEDVEALAANPQLQVLETESLRQFYMILNTTSGPLADVRMRRAIAAVFDPELIADEFLRGHATVPRGPIPPRLPGFNPDIQPTEHNMEAAQELLQEAGAINSGVSLTYVHFAPYTWQRINGEIIQAALAPFGINVTVEGLPFTTLTERMVNPTTRPDITAAAVGIPTTNPMGLLRPFFHPDSNHWSRNGYVNETVGELLDRASVSLDPSERMSLFHDVQSIVMDDLPIIPFTILNDVKVARANVRGYQFQPVRPAAVNWYGLYFED